MIAKIGLLYLNSAVVGKIVVHNYLVNAILSQYLTTSFYCFHIVGRVTKQNTVIFSTIYLAICTPLTKIQKYFKNPI